MTKTIQINRYGELVFTFPANRHLARGMRRFEGSGYLKWAGCWIAPPTETNLTQAQAFGTQYGFQIDLTAPDASRHAHSLLEHFERGRVDASRATCASEDMPIPDLGGWLYPFQEAAVWYAARTQRCFVADESGLGKTIQALATLQYVDAFPALIVCPLSLKWHWQAEIQRWLPRRTVQVAYPGKRMGRADLTIIHYELLPKKPGVKALQAKAIIVDEGHLLNNTGFSIPQDLAEDIPYRLLLTGTPVVNHPADLLAPLSFLNLLDELGGYRYFVDRYCAGGGFRNILGLEGAHNLPELNEKLRIHGYIRRTKAQVLPHLPEKKRRVVHLAVPQGKFHKKAVAEYQTWVAQNPDLAAQEKLAAPDLPAFISAAFYAKWPSVMAWLTQFTKSGEKVVIMTNHMEAIKELEDTFQALTITRNTRPEERQAFVNQFQNDPTCRMLVLTLNMGGLGWPLHAACHIVFAELSWSPAEHTQTESRLHTIGQQRPVHAWYLLAQGTIEEKLYPFIENKRKFIEPVTEGTLWNPHT